MKLEEAILKRRTIRNFKAELISDESIEIILKSAMAAPSARNKQPWLFYVIKDKDIQAELKKLSINYDYNAPLMIVVCGNLYDEKVSGDEFWVQDCSAAIENMLLTATSINIGSCWCGIYPKKDLTKAVKNLLNLKEQIIPLALIHFGYPEEELCGRSQYDAKKVVIL